MKKKIYLLIAAFAIIPLLRAQTLELAGYGSYKSTWLFNKNISDKGDIQDYAAGWGYNYGVGATFYFNPQLGIELGGLMNLHSGNYKGTMDSNRTYTSAVKLSSFEIPILFKMKSEYGGYLEVGPQIGIINKADYTFNQSYYNSKTGTNVNKDRSMDASPYYSPVNISAVLGFGMKIKLSDRLAIKTGIRLEYGLSDFKGVDGLGELLSDKVLYPNAAATHSAAGGLILGLTWTLGSEEESSGTKPPPPPPN